ncbi:MAG: hypothetical protein JKX79_11740 [Labilibaculum sp.]|nr:hypothetical protein [Labilibaculum sp.]
MMKFIVFGIIVIILSSCRSSKEMITRDIRTSKTEMVKIEKNDCQKKAEEKSEFLRGYGLGISADRMMARDIASSIARNEILNAVQVCTSNMIERYNQQHSSSDGGEMARIDAGRVKQIVGSVAEETLNGAKIISTCDYKVGDKYETHVCVELTNIDFTKKAYNKLTRDEKILIDYEAEKFKSDFINGLNEYRERRTQGL